MMPADRPEGPLILELDAGPPLATCESTQQIAREMALQGAPEGTCVLAAGQTAGRGRRDRSWHSPSGMGLWMSFLLRPAADESVWIALTPLTALAAATALESLWGGASESAVAGESPGELPAAAPESQRPGAAASRGAGVAEPAGADVRDGREPKREWKAWIKWPNDVYGSYGKIGGILAETAGEAIVIGLGLNLRQKADDFPTDLRGRASSLRIEGFFPVPDVRAVALAFNQALTGAYAEFSKGELGFLREGLLGRFMLRNMRVRVVGAGEAIEGTACDLGELGELILETACGLRTVISGEVELPDGPRAGQGG